jgi:membrane-bound ClpP family serine protease
MNPPRHQAPRVKRERSSPLQVIVGYGILQLPSLALIILILILVRRWIDLPEWLIWCLVAIWVAKEAIMFPSVWRVYKQRVRGGAASYVGARGTAEERLDPTGYVRVHEELWWARVSAGVRPVEPGETVRIRRIDGLTLLVEPENTDNDEHTK